MDKFLKDIEIAYNDNLLNDNEYVLLTELFISFYTREPRTSEENEMSEKTSKATREPRETYLKYIFLGKHVYDLLNDVK